MSWLVAFLGLNVLPVMSFTFGWLDVDMGTRLEPRKQGSEQLLFTL